MTEEMREKLKATYNLEGLRIQLNDNGCDCETASAAEIEANLNLFTEVHPGHQTIVAELLYEEYGAEYDCPHCKDKGCPACDEELAREADIARYYEKKGMHHPDCCCNRCIGMIRES